MEKKPKPSRKALKKLEELKMQLYQKQIKLQKLERLMTVRKMSSSRCKSNFSYHSQNNLSMLNMNSSLASTSIQHYPSSTVTCDSSTKVSSNDASIQDNLCANEQMIMENDNSMSAYCNDSLSLSHKPKIADKQVSSNPPCNETATTCINPVTKNHEAEEFFQKFMVMAQVDKEQMNKVLETGDDFFIDDMMTTPMDNDNSHEDKSQECVALNISVDSNELEDKKLEPQTGVKTDFLKLLQEPQFVPISAMVAKFESDKRKSDGIGFYNNIAETSKNNIELKAQQINNQNNSIPSKDESDWEHSKKTFNLISELKDISMDRVSEVVVDSFDSVPSKKYLIDKELSTPVALTQLCNLQDYEFTQNCYDSCPVQSTDVNMVSDMEFSEMSSQHQLETSLVKMNTSTIEKLNEDDRNLNQDMEIIDFNTQTETKTNEQKKNDAYEEWMKLSSEPKVGYDFLTMNDIISVEQYPELFDKDGCYIVSKEDNKYRSIASGCISKVSTDDLKDMMVVWIKEKCFIVLFLDKEIQIYEESEESLIIYETWALNDDQLHIVKGFCLKDNNRFLVGVVVQTDTGGIDTEFFDVDTEERVVKSLEIICKSLQVEDYIPTCDIRLCSLDGLAFVSGIMDNRTKASFNIFIQDKDSELSLMSFDCDFVFAPFTSICYAEHSLAFVVVQRGEWMVWKYKDEQCQSWKMKKPISLVSQALYSMVDQEKYCLLLYSDTDKNNEKICRLILSSMDTGDTSELCTYKPVEKEKKFCYSDFKLMVAGEDVITLYQGTFKVFHFWSGDELASIVDDEITSVHAGGNVLVFHYENGCVRVMHM